MKIIAQKEEYLPKYATTGSAGMDLVAAINQPVSLKPGERTMVSTGIKIKLDEGHEAQIRPRSGLAIRNGITVLNTPGTIDADYIDDVKVILRNTGDKDFTILPNMRIAQMVINKYERPNIEVVDDFTIEEKETNRGGGFGSTGLFTDEKVIPEQAEAEELDVDFGELEPFAEEE